MLTRRAALSGLATASLPFRASAQGFPSRTITIVVPYAPGGRGGEQWVWMSMRA